MPNDMVRLAVHSRLALITLGAKRDFVCDQRLKSSGAERAQVFALPSCDLGEATATDTIRHPGGQNNHKTDEECHKILFRMTNNSRGTVPVRTTAATDSDRHLYLHLISNLQLHRS
jgi:hypothetical protein